VDEQSQTIVAFEWENPTTERKVQLCWTVLPQGFKNSHTLFDTSASELLGPCSLVPGFQLGDSVYICTWKDELLKEKCEGPDVVLLTTYTAGKVEGISSWVHYTPVKPAPLPEAKDKQRAASTGPLKTVLSHYQVAKQRVMYSLSFFKLRDQLCFSKNGTAQKICGKTWLGMF